MGIDKVDLKYAVKETNNMANGYNADGTKPAYGLMDTGVEKAMFGVGALMPVWQYKGKVGEAWQNRSWQNVKSAYSQGWKNAGQTLKHPMNYFDIEFLNEKTLKLEAIMEKNTPKLPKGFKGNQATKDLFDQLVKAKNPKEFAQLIKDNKATYKKLKNILSRTAPEELKKLQNISKYNEMYGSLLKDFKTAHAKALRGQLPKGSVSKLHERFSKARYAENKFIRAAKSGKAGAGLYAKTGAKMSKGVKQAMSASKTLRGLNRGVGKAGGWICAGLSALTAGLDIYSAVAASPEGEGLQNGLKQAGKSAGRLACELGGAAVGQWAGAAIGQVLIPIPGVGAAIGGFVGSFVGMWVGSKIADNVPALNKTVAEEITEEQTQKTNELLYDAIESDDLETVYNYTSQFKQPVVDEQGNQVTDENGNPVVDYVQVYDDEEKQKEFEKRIESLDNYVETEASKQQEAEMLKQEAEAEKARKMQEMNFAGSQYYMPSFNNSVYNGGYSFASKTPTFGPAGTSNSSTSSATQGASWQNPAWQNSLADSFNNGNFYSFNPSNYSSMWMMNNYNQNQYKFGAAA